MGVDSELTSVRPRVSGSWAIFSDEMAHHLTHVDAAGACTLDAVIQPGTVKVWAILWPKDSTEGLFAPFAPYPSSDATWKDFFELSRSEKYDVLVFVLEAGDVV